jgi:hypothetical protein
VRVLLILLCGVFLWQPEIAFSQARDGVGTQKPEPIKDNQRPPLNNRNTNHSDGLALDGKQGASDYSLDRNVLEDEFGDDLVLFTKPDELPLMAKPELSPGGTHIAYFGGANGEKLLTVFSFVDGSTKSMASPEGAEFYWFDWANSDRLIFTIRTKFDKDGIWADFSNYREARLFAVDKDMSNSLNLFKPVVRGGIVQVQPRLVVKNQARMIDILPNDPAHVLLAVDEKIDRYSESRVRKINIYDASYEIIQGERKHAYHWKTDQNNQVRFGFTNFTRNVTGEDSEYSAIYLNPETEHWDTVHNQPVFKDQGYKLISFSPNPHQAYIVKGKEKIALYDIVAQEIVEHYCTNGEKIGALVVDDQKAIGCRNENETYFFNDKRSQVHSLMNAQFGDARTIIVSSQEKLNKYIIYSMPLGQAGAYYLLDLGAGSLSKIMDRY